MSPEFRSVAVVSCDISGHSSTSSEQQLANVVAINGIVEKALRACPDGDVVWCSGGDGGHTVFRGPDWQEPVLALMGDLVRWARENGVLLRTTGHHGPAAEVPGADGRVQLVGEALNYAGWLVNELDVSGVVVSDRFEEEFSIAGVEFHEPRLMPAKSLDTHRLYLMSFDGVRSNWTAPTHEDHANLRRALEEKHGWEVVFYAKRIWQVDPADAEATSAVNGLRGELLRPAVAGEVEESGKRAISLFDHMTEAEVFEVVSLGQLVERPAGSVICKHDDGGDTMFVILRGRVGVYNSEGAGLSGTSKPKHLLRYGEIAGELAYALSRRRTADLVALSDVAMLSFSSAELRTRLDQVGAVTRRRVLDFFSGRVLEHVSDRAPHLLPLLRAGRTEARLLDVGQEFDAVSLDVLDPDVKLRNGLYVLVSGRVSHGQVVLDGRTFPLLWAEIPGMAVPKPVSYELESEECRILHVKADGITALDRQQRKALRAALLAEGERPGDGFEYDVFISHAHHDLPVVDDVCAAFREAGIRYWIDSGEVQAGGVVVSRIEQGLHRSRFFLACLSRAYVESRWCRVELDTALHADVERGDGALIPLVVEDVELDVPMLVQTRRTLSWSNRDHVDELVRRLRARY